MLAKYTIAGLAGSALLASCRVRAIADDAFREHQDGACARDGVGHVFVVSGHLARLEDGRPERVQ